MSLTRGYSTIMSFRTCVVLTTLSAAACASGLPRPAEQSDSPRSAACAPFERPEDPVWYYIPEDGFGLTKEAAKDSAFTRALLNTTVAPSVDGWFCTGRSAPLDGDGASRINGTRVRSA